VVVFPLLPLCALRGLCVTDGFRGLPLLQVPAARKRASSEVARGLRSCSLPLLGARMGAGARQAL